MGILPCSIACNSNKESNSQKNDPQHSDSSSLSSQSSLRSVPSLTSRPQNPSIYHQCLSTLKGHSSYVFALAVAGKILYSGSSDSKIRIWKPEASESEKSSQVVVFGKSAVKSVVIFGDKLFTAHQDHKIRVWQINSDKFHNYKLLATLPTLKDRVLRYLPPKNHVQVRRHKTCTWVHHVDTISSLAISKDRSTLYSVSWDRTLKIWRTSDFMCLESVADAHNDAINALAVSGDGFIYTGSADTKIKVWSKLSGQKHSLMGTLEKHKSAINALVLSSDGSLLYSGACDRSIVVWERDNGANHMVVVGALRGHAKAILCLTLVSEMVCSGSADQTVRIWKRGEDKSYSCLAVLEGHRGPIKCLAAAVDRFTRSPSGGTSHLIYSGSLDCDIKVWQLFVPTPDDGRSQ